MKRIIPLFLFLENNDLKLIRVFSLLCYSFVETRWNKPHLLQNIQLRGLSKKFAERASTNKRRYKLTVSFLWHYVNAKMTTRRTPTSYKKNIINSLLKKPSLMLCCICIYGPTQFTDSLESCGAKLMLNLKYLHYTINYLTWNFAIFKKKYLSL